MKIVRENVEHELTLPESKAAPDALRKIGTVLLCILCVALLAGGLWWFLTVQWGSTAWANLTIEEFLFTLTMPLAGTNSDMVMEHVRLCIVPALIAAGCAIVVLILLKKKKPFFHSVQVLIAVVGIFLAGFAFTKFWTVLDLSNYVASRSEYSSFFDENYVDPAQVDLKFPEKKRNLIYIFLESMENTYADQSVGGAFEENRIPELTQLSLENENFSGDNSTLNGGHPMTGATWTMGGMFAQTSGMPIIYSGNANNLDKSETFYPGVTALGDILEEEGYEQIYILGSDAVFAGRKLYFTQHGNFDILDYYYYLEQGVVEKGDYHWWGYDDQQLFENARNKLEELSSSETPFNLMLLTVDTHFEDGWVCDLCDDKFDDQYSNVFACSSRQVTEFVRWCQKQPFYENTTIVISGDHLTMDSDYCEYVPSDYDRTVFSTIINSAVENENTYRREFTTFDMFPTTLAAMGVKIPGNRLGLGVNLFSDQKTLYEIYGSSLMNKGISSKSELMDRFAEGLGSDSAVLKNSYYDEDTDTIHLVADNISISQENDTITASCWSKIDGSDMVWYTLEHRSVDDSYSCNIPLSDFNYAFGTYRINVYSDSDSTHTYIGSYYVTVEDPEDDNSEESPNPEVYVGEVDYTNSEVEIAVAGVPADAVVCNIAIWRNKDQSDLKWYQGIKHDDGLYYINVFMTDFGIISDTYNIHVYYYYPNGDIYILLANTYKIG